MIDGFKMGFIEDVEPLKLTKIPKKYQKFIEEREKIWFEKIKELDKKLEFQKECEIKAITLQATEILQKKEREFKSKLALTEKALELACDDIWAMSIWENTKEEVIEDSVEFYKTKAKEMMKSE